MNVSQACIDSLLSLVGDHFHAVAFMVEGRLKEREMNRCHRRCQDDVIGLILFGEDGLRVGIRFRFYRHGLAVIHDEEERTETDADGTEVRAFIDFQQCVDLMAVGQDILHLVGNDSVEATTEGVQFDQFQVLMLLYILGSPVEARVVRPLVDDAQVARELAQGRYTILCEDGQAEAVDELRNTMVDFRVDVIGTAAQDDAPFAFLFQHIESCLGHSIILFFIVCFFLPGGLAGFLDFVLTEAPDAQFFLQTGDNAVLIVKRQEGAKIERIGVAQPFSHVVADDFRIAHDHGAVKGIILAAFLRPVLDAGIENTVYFLFQQVFDMAVDELGRIARRIGRYRIHGLLENLL